MSEAEMVNPGSPSETGNPVERKHLVKNRRLLRRSDAEWLEIFKEQRDSGLSLIEYCAPKGMSHTSFSTKRSRLMEKYAIESFDNFDIDSMELVLRGRLKVDATKDITSLSISNNARDTNMSGSDNQLRFIRVIVDDHVVVEIPADLDPHWIAALILKLRQDCNV